MAKNMGVVIVRLEMENQDALKQFNEAMGVIEDVAEETPWRPELQEAYEKLVEVGKNLRPRGTSS